MGANGSALRFLACSDFYKYVANSCHVKSSCSDCCKFDMDTDMVSVTESESEDAVRVCCI